MKRRLAISPCPNDTYAFYGLLHAKTNYAMPLETRFADIEALNHLCMSGEVDFCKISFHTYLLIRDHYRLLKSGSALGFGCGPLVIAKKAMNPAELKGKRIAIPGPYTTATLLLQLWLGQNLNLVEKSFDEIMPAITKGEVDAGLIIHESRFTYARFGLVSLVDLGDWWEKETGTPIPLGGIVARKDLNEAEITAFENALQQSILYANRNPAEALPFMQKHAQEMEPEVMRKHVELYVNEYTLDLGIQGISAINALIERSPLATSLNL